MLDDMVDDVAGDDHILELLERAAGEPPSASRALAHLRPRIRRAHRRRAAVRGGAGLVALVVVGSLVSSTTSHTSRDVRVGGSGTTAAIESTTTTAEPLDSPPTTLGAESAAPAPPAADAPAGRAEQDAAAPSSATPHAGNAVEGATNRAPASGPAPSTVTRQSTVTHTQSSAAPAAAAPAGPTQVTSFDAQGGSIEVHYSESSMTLSGVNPSPGWSIAETKSDGASIQVTFEQESGDGDPVGIGVHLDEGVPVVDQAAETADQPTGS